MIGNSIENGISALTATFSSLQDNSFSYNNSYPIQLLPDYVAALSNFNTFTNTDSDSYVHVNSGTISHDATWLNLPILYRIFGNITILGTDGDDGVTTLTLQPGVELRFNRSTRFIVGTSSGNPGALVAEGTAGNPIIFTSAQEVKTPGDWYGIIFYQTSASLSSLNHCIVEYAGYSSWGGIYIYNSSPQINNCTIRNNQNYGIRVSQGTPTITNSHITANGSYGVYIQNATPSITYSSIIDNGNYAMTNTTSNIIVNAENNWWGDATGPLDESPIGLYNPDGRGDCVSDYIDYEPWSLTSCMSLLDSDGDGLTDCEEIHIYGTDPYLADTDGDGINDGDEVAFWGSRWNQDFDGDGLINILDWDSDGDGFSDGFEIEQGTDPGDPHSFPVFEVHDAALIPIRYLLLK